MEDTLMPQSDLLTIPEVAKILRVDETTVRRWVKSGALPAMILPCINKRAQKRIPRAAVEKILIPMTFN